MRHRRAAPAARDRARAPEERSLTAPQSRFVGSFPRADAPLDPPLPEIALIGRSNVGKSSLLNALAGARVARVSGTPGKTRALNVFLVALGSGPSASYQRVRLPAPRSLYVLDLPGYGYAKASKAERALFQRLVRHALERPRVAGVVWLLDIRREPSADDRAMQDLLAARRARVLAAVTKSDKLPRGERQRRARDLQERLALDADQVILTSARTREGVDELREAIAALVGGGGGGLESA